MRRMAVGLVWFVGLYLGALFVGGAIVGFQAATEIDHRSVASVSDGYNKGHDAGKQAGEKFGAQYGGAIFLSCLIVSIVGTATGYLPGTEKIK